MGFDRQYFVDTRDGFSAIGRVGMSDSGPLFSKTVAIAERGLYYLQYYTEPFCAVTVLSPSPRFTPLLHGEDPEVIVELTEGENEILLSTKIECRVYVRLFDAEGRMLRDDFLTPYTEVAEGSLTPKAPSISGYSLGVGAAISSYGRFGFAKGDGVLDYSMPAFGIISRPFVTGHPKYREDTMWSFSLLPEGELESGSVMEAYKLPDNEKIEVDWTHTSWKRELQGGKYISFDYSLLTPILEIETNLDNLRLSRLGAIGVPSSITLPKKEGFLTKTPSSNILYDRERDGENELDFVILSRQNRFPETPILLIFPRSPERILKDKDEIRILFDGEIGTVGLSFLLGIELLDKGELTPKLYERLTEHALLLYKTSLARPVKCKEYYRVTDNRVNIINEFTYKTRKDKRGTKPLYTAPLPPPLLLDDNSTRKEEDAASLSHPTKYGPLYAVLNSTYSEYAIPIPEYREFIPFSAKCKEEYTKLLHSDFDEYIRYHTDVEEIPNPGNYSFVFQYALCAKLFPYLSGEDRGRLSELMLKGVGAVTDPGFKYIGPKGRRCESWYERREPFSGISYLNTYLHITGISKYEHCDRETIENSDKVFIEVDWGNAMSLYGVYLAALASGGLELLENSFDVIRRAFDYYLVGMDFACMCSAYAECGVTWNDGTGYGGYLGFINICDTLGRVEDLNLGLYAYAKMCSVRRGMFLSTQNYFCKYFGREPWYILKHFHEETDGNCAFTSYPLDAIYGSYRREGLYNLTTEGHYKEAFRMYSEYLPKEVDKLLGAVEESVRVPITGKTKLEVKYHSDRNGILSEQETYSYLALAIMRKRFPAQELYRMVNEAADNRRISREMLGHYLLSHRRVPRELTRISLLTEIDSRDEVRITAWRGLVIGDATYPTLELTEVSENAWLEIYSPKPPRAMLDGKELTVSRLRKGIYRVYPDTVGVVTFSTD